MALTTREKWNRYRDRHIALGLCIECDNKAIPRQQLCPICAVKRKAREKARYKKNKASHAARHQRNRERYKREGRCPTCSAPLGEEDEGRLKCLNCRTRK